LKLYENVFKKSYDLRLKQKVNWSLKDKNTVHTEVNMLTFEHSLNNSLAHLKELVPSEYLKEPVPSNY